MSDIVPFVLIFRAVKLVHHARDEAANVKRPQRWVKWLGKSATSERSQNCADIHLLWMLTLSFVISQQLNAYLLRYSIPGYYLRTRLVIFDLSKLPMFTQLLVSFEIFQFCYF